MSARRWLCAGKNCSEQVGKYPRDLESALERLSEYDDQTKLRLLGLLAQGTSTFFDAKTHRQVRQVFTRLHYVYLAGEILRNSDNQALEEDVLEHLQKAQQAQRRAWGESERLRLGENAPAIPAEELGHAIQTQIYRQVLLGAITELWVDYLTRVEALRVSVGLEAYAQADPLVKYKSRGFGDVPEPAGRYPCGCYQPDLPVPATRSRNANRNRCRHSTPPCQRQCRTNACATYAGRHR